MESENGVRRVCGEDRGNRLGCLWPQPRVMEVKYVAGTLRPISNVKVTGTGY